MSDAPPLPWQRRAKLTAFAVLPALVLLLTALGVARVATFREFRFVTDSLTGVSYYHMRVGGWPWQRPSVTRLNSLGFPDVEFAGLEPKGSCIHLVFAGDSFTFGDAVDGDRNWVSLVRDRAGASFRDRCVRIFNLAAPMTTIVQQAARIQETYAVLQPDFIVLGQYQNDLTDLTIPGVTAPASTGGGSADTASGAPRFWGDRLRAITPGYDSALPRMLAYRMMEFFGEHRIKYDVLRRWSVLADSSTAAEARELTHVYETHFHTLVEEIRRRGAGFAVVIFPSKLDIVAQRYPEGVFFEALAKREGVPSLSLMPVLDTNRRPFPFLTYDGHMNERGNRIAADAIFRWLFVEGVGPLPDLRSRTGPPQPAKAVTWWPR